MLFSVFYLSLFLSVGLLSARRAVPDGSAAVIVPLGCGFGASLLAVLPALFAVVLGFTLPAVALAATAARRRASGQRFCTAARGCTAWRRTPTAGPCGPACCR